MPDHDPPHDDAPARGPWTVDDPPHVEPRTDRATAFDEEEALRPREGSGRGRVRGVLRRMRGPEGESRWDADIRRCQTPVPEGRRIAVISRKGGVGKTTTTLMVGHTLAAVRPDRVLAIDGNPDAGTLGHRVASQTSATVLEAIERIGSIRGYPDVRRLTSQAPSRLEVMASPEDPHASRACAGADYMRLIDAVEAHYSIVLCDTGTGILDDATQGILQATDQVVLVAGVAVDTARTAGMTLDWLEANGHAALVRDAVVVLNAAVEAPRVDLDRIAGHFVDRSRSVHVVPYDRHLESGAVTNPDALSAGSQAAWLQVAAAVAEGFSLPSPRGGSEVTP